MNDGRRYRAFISYSHEDAKAAKWMQHAIETYRLPRQLVRSLGFDGNRLGSLEIHWEVPSHFYGEECCALVQHCAVAAPK